MNIVLYEPEIPANTGNIGRTCVATSSSLHLIEPLGFRLTDRYIKRSGMDYWDRVNVKRYNDWQDFIQQNDNPKCFFATTKSGRIYTDVEYKPDDYLVFGPESRGLPENMLFRESGSCIRIPMIKGERSLNLSNAVSIVLYEAFRQNNFLGLDFCEGGIV